MRRMLRQRGIAHVRSHAIAYSALFLALTGSAAAVTGIQTKAQDRPADEVLVYPAKFVHPGDEETLLRANGIKVVGVCAADSSQIKIGPVQDGGPQRVMTVYSDSHTRGFVHGSTKAFITMASGPPDDRGDFNAFTNNLSRGSLDGSFVLTHGGGGCGFEAGAIAS